MASVTKKAKSAAKKNGGIKTMDLILIITVVLLIVFSIAMICIFCVKDAIPDTLCTCFFAAFGGECGIMGWIQTVKTKYRDREWQKEDEEREKKESEGAENDT